MNSKSNSNVTVGQFVTALINSSNCIPQPTDYMTYGYQSGWLEDMDISGKNDPLLKKNAARIVHEFIRIELQDPDLEDVSCASKLHDLYDCRVCTKHVMQVYAKGIMRGYYATDTLYLFGMNETVNEADMLEILSRIFDSNIRSSPKQ